MSFRQLQRSANYYLKILMSKLVQFKLRDHQIDRAREYTSRRVAINRARYSGTSKQVRGRKYCGVLDAVVDSEFYVDFLGLLAEVVVRDYFERNTGVVGMVVSSFLKRSEDVLDHDSDIVVCKSDGTETRVSVKGTERNYVVNKAAAEADDSDVLVYVRFGGNGVVFLRTFTMSDVLGWELRSGRTEYFFKRFNEDD